MAACAIPRNQAAADIQRVRDATEREDRNGFKDSESVRVRSDCCWNRYEQVVLSKVLRTKLDKDDRKI